MSQPKVTLVTHTHLPLETVYSVWQASKNEEPLMLPEEVKEKVPAEEIQKLFRAVIAQRIPIGEHVDFVFMIENVSVSWREQAVRHRIGTKPSPERVGIDHVHLDVIPDLADSSWWSQSMRIQDMSRFAEREAYRLPQTVIDAGDDAVLMFKSAMSSVASSYRKLVEMGVPMEDARELIPLGAQHRISWKLNIGALQHIAAKRGCWILQLGIWGPVIMGMIKELTTKVHPIFSELVTPPCLNGDTYNGCVFQEEVRRRYSGDDKLPPCPLHFHHEVARGTDGSDTYKPAVQELFSVPMADTMRSRAEDYRTFWGRDPYTGKREAR